jgi:uncharacterized membrane protein YvlD (DUF360 family)
MTDWTQRWASGITLKAIIIGMILIVANAHWLTITSELMEPPFYLTFVSLFFNAVMSLFVLVMGNLLLKPFVPRHCLSSQELWSFISWWS